MSIDRPSVRAPDRDVFSQEFLDGVAFDAGRSQLLTAQEFRNEVAGQAHRRHARRGYHHGDDLADWLATEASVKAGLVSDKRRRGYEGLA